MNNEDETLRKLMTGNGDNYLMDDGFTARVMESLPRKRAVSPARRTLLILAGTVAGCTLSAILCASSIGETMNTLAERLSVISTPENNVWAYVYLATALAFSSLLGVLCLRPGRE